MSKIAGFVDIINGHARTMPVGAPPIVVAHPHFGKIGLCDPKRGLVPNRGEWLSFEAIKRDADRRTVKLLRRFEDNVPRAILMAAAALIAKNPMAGPILVGAISSYDGLIAARGGGDMQDIWMYMTANQTPVTTSWYDMLNFANMSPATAPTITAYANGGTGGAVLDAASNGSWLTNPTAGHNKYIIGVGISVTAINGFTLAMLVDNLWAGEYSLTSNATINPTTDVAVTRWAATDAGADFAGGNMMQLRLSATLTHTVAPVITTTYVNQAGTDSRTTISTCPATGPLINRIIGNTTHNSATVLNHTPFMPLTNGAGSGGDSGVTSLSQVVISGGTATSGSVSHKIVRPLILMPFIAASSYIEQDVTLNIGNMVQLRSVAQVCGCLGWNLYSNGTTAAAMSAFLRTVEG
jgi:hypothetical protein